MSSVMLVHAGNGESPDGEESSPPRHGISGHYLYPGELFASPEPLTVTTILGTCVAVCVWDPKAKVGGINHFLLPYAVGNGQASPRFGNVANRMLIEKVTALGASPRGMCAKLFGGMSSRIRPGVDGRDLGLANVELAKKFLDEARIPIVAEDVGGDRGRKLVFRLSDGTAWVRKL